MDPFIEMMERTQSSLYYDQMCRFAKPLHDHFGINHFWYYRISRSGFYSYAGTHAAWNEYCFGHSLTKHFPCLRHPNVLRSGITLMRPGSNVPYAQVLQRAWEKF